MVSFRVSYFRSSDGMIGPAIFAFVGSMIIALGIYLYLDTKDFVSRAVEVPGTVIELEPMGRGTRSPNVEYKDLYGRTAILYSQSGSRPPAFYVGEEVKVLYDPTDRRHERTARINDFRELWGGTVFLVPFGSFFVAIGILFFYINRRKRAANSSFKPNPLRGSA